MTGPDDDNGGWQRLGDLHTSSDLFEQTIEQHVQRCFAEAQEQWRDELASVSEATRARALASLEALIRTHTRQALESVRACLLRDVDTDSVQ